MRACESLFEGQEELQRTVAAPAGKEHYRLLARLASWIDGGTIIDIGTHHGLSAAALACGNPSNRVVTFDVADFITGAAARERFDRLPNVERSMDNLWEAEARERWRDTLVGARLILLDVEPHGGEMEMQLLRWLDDQGYAGLLLCDDIWYFKDMRDRFWSQIPAERKVDLTTVGHWSGTGLVTFRNTPPLRLSVVLREDERAVGSGFWDDCAAGGSPSGAKDFGGSPSGAKDFEKGSASGGAPRCLPQEGQDGSDAWTVVTAFFELAKLPDATAPIRARDSTHYLKHAAMTLSLNVNMVVFCDPEWREALEQLRPAHLRPRTRFVARAFTDFPLVRDWHGRILAARGGDGTHVDPRNTASYYLLCMLRYVMLSETIADNPFRSSHFAWVNICIERMSWKGAMYFPRVWSERRDRFSTCYIDYQPRALTRDLHEYYRGGGRCGMCSGFFTGSAENMRRVAELLLLKFEELARQGLGHADEQLFSLVYFDHPELFEPYLGDYTEMVVNYGWVRENAHAPVRNVLRNLAASGEDPRLLAKLCARWLESVRRGCATVPPGMVNHVSALFRDAAIAQFPDLRTTVIGRAGRVGTPSGAPEGPSGGAAAKELGETASP
jgi:hypothetical protein